MVYSVRIWFLITVGCLALSQGEGKSSSRVPKIDRVNHYEPLSYNRKPLQDKHDRIARGIISEPQIRNLQIHFSAYDRKFHLVLHPSKTAFPSGVQFMVNGKRSTSYDPATFYEGKVQGDPTSRVTGHVINGVFSGIIRTSEGTYHVERARKFFQDHDDETFHSLIYHEHDIDFPQHPSGCGINGTSYEQMKALQASAVPINSKTSKQTETMAQFFKKSRSKRALTSTGGNFCHMRVSVDHLFYSQIGDSDDTTTFAEVITTFNFVQEIFQETDFDGDGEKDSITPSIQEFNILKQTDVGYRFGAGSIAVNDFLDLWSQQDHTDFCLALLLTNRDFDDGVLGLAWVAQPPGGNRGGICENTVRLSVGDRSLNTAIVTFTNFGREQPRAVTVVTIAHELGHNFGSPHDPNTNECSPGGSSGNYIMFSRATNGQHSNNNNFSPCSIRDMRAVLQSSKSDCFSNEAFCGNGILEDDEQCDRDICCDNDTCTLLAGAQCSSQQGCCDTSCRIISNDTECRESTDCSIAAFCTNNTNSADRPGDCPPSVARAMGDLCNNDSNVCDDSGNCVGSYCLRFTGLQECQCTAADGYDEIRFCDVCCRYEGRCQSTFDLFNVQELSAMGLTGLTLDPGRSCNNFEGYCSQKGETTAGVSTCIVVDNEQTLDDLLDLLSFDTINSIVEWLTVYWWIAIIIIIAFVVIFVLLQVTYRKRLPLKRRLSRARNSFRRGSTSGTSGPGPGPVPERQNRGGRGRRRRDQGRRQLSPDDAVRRLSAFFPTADSGTVQDVIRQSSSESKAVRRMLELGFPMKKIPIPRA